MNRGLKNSEHNRFPFDIKEGSTIENLIEELHEEYGDRFKVYLDDTHEKSLRRDAIVFVNGMNMVARDGIRTKVSKGDLIVFMIAAVGG
jgi:molybdopterin converting factor small subunit